MRRLRASGLPSKGSPFHGQRCENAWQADRYVLNPYGSADSVVVASLARTEQTATDNTSKESRLQSGSCSTRPESGCETVGHTQAPRRRTPVRALSRLRRVGTRSSAHSERTRPPECFRWRDGQGHRNACSAKWRATACSQSQGVGRRCEGCARQGGGVAQSSALGHAMAVGRTGRGEPQSRQAYEPCSRSDPLASQGPRCSKARHLPATGGFDEPRYLTTGAS